MEFAPDLSRISFAEGGELRFRRGPRGRRTATCSLFRSRYRQPFGTFAGELPGGLRLAEARA